MAANNENPATTRFHRTVNIAAIVTAVLIFPLVMVGAGVTSNDAGMAFPDWPTSNQHLLNPPGWLQEWDKLWEHGHRLIGWIVGMTAIVLAVTAWPRGGVVRALGLLTLVAISVQGVLGGVRVTHASTTLAMVHGIWGQVCFCLACSTALMTSRAWHRGRAIQGVQAANILQRGCLVTAVAVFVQLVLGAALRHFGSNYAVVAHLMWAVLVALLVGWIAMWVAGQHSGEDLLGLLGRVLAFAIVAQLLLGGLAFLITVLKVVRDGPMVWFVPSAHVAVGAVLLATSVLLTLTTYRRLYTPEHHHDAATTTEAALS